ncbi:hypothetical protein [Spiroplasma endosymbiont of Polydrusus cervinus]|uniref:hypothetical protein n=1 Tax=Spiroplasma endosymbiont of Polydrusus cervinus TaxID=3066287 RepID=UPI0030CDD3BC
MNKAHIVASFMTLQAAVLKIGSSIMGAITRIETSSFFSEHQIVDPTKWHLALGMLFGYYDDKVTGTSFPRLRIAEDEFVTIF